MHIFDAVVLIAGFFVHTKNSGITSGERLSDDDTPADGGMKNWMMAGSADGFEE